MGTGRRAESACGAPARSVGSSAAHAARSIGAGFARSGYATGRDGRARLAAGFRTGADESPVGGRNQRRTCSARRFAGGASTGGGQSARAPW